MQFLQTAIGGVHIIEVDKTRDERGSFARIYCSDEFRSLGLELPDSQIAISENRLTGTLRGLHYIEEDVGEAKLVRCIRGAIFDVAVDLRRGSSTFGRHVTIYLHAEAGNAIYLPRGVAHGFVTLEDESDLLYQFSQPHRAGLEKGVRWNDPNIGIKWPLAPVVLSDRDRTLPFLAELTI
jgi:dTDP-4-dehydrorhamnose 3,5-epimerase